MRRAPDSGLTLTTPTWSVAVPFELASLLPPGVEPMTALALVGLSLVTSLITATFSLGGGILMVAVLALVFPPAVVVPVHGCVQLGSNGGRAVVQRRHIQWAYVGWIGLGAAFGAIAGGAFASRLPENLFQIAIAVFILISIWLPLPKVMAHGRVTQVVAGFFISGLSMVVGAVGPLVAVFLKSLPDRRQLVATHATLLTIQNLFKVLTFIGLGFAFADYVPLIIAMVISGFVGTTIGSGLLVRIPEAAFRHGFRVVVTLVALNLLREALF